MTVYILCEYEDIIGVFYKFETAMEKRKNMMEDSNLSNHQRTKLTIEPHEVE